MGALINRPTYSERVRQKTTLEPLTGPQHIRNLLYRFPEDLYHKAPETHLYKFLTALIGPAGVGSLAKQSFQARTALEEAGVQLFDLENFFGDPLSFPRILEEVYAIDPEGLQVFDDQETIRLSDERYRSRILDYVAGARAGTTPLGMRLAAKAGLGHEVEIVENYWHFYDLHSDDPLGFPYYGRSASLQEMIVLPRREESVSEVQTITLTDGPTAGNLILKFDGQLTTTIAYDAEAYEVEAALRALSNIGENGVEVTGGAGPDTPWVVYFRGHLSNRDVPTLQAIPNLTGPVGTDPDVEITVETGGQESTEETVAISSRQQHELQTALDKVRPVGTIPTVADAAGTRTRQHWANVYASSEYNEIVRFVTGQRQVNWPPVDGIRWIERGIEKEAPRVVHDSQYHYVGFHTPLSVRAHTDAALDDADYEEDYSVLADYRSEHIGRFDAQLAYLPIFDYLRHTDDILRFTADRALADYAEPLNIATVADRTTLVNGVYPSEYVGLKGVPTVKYKEEQFWASLERVSGTEYLEIDFGSPVALNFINLEISRKPVNIEVAYDCLGLGTRRDFCVISNTQAGTDVPTTVAPSNEDSNPWEGLAFFFEDGLGRPIITQYLRLGFTRQADFLTNPTTSSAVPWSIEVRNMRLGRNTANY